MAHETHAPSFEDRFAEQFARIGLITSLLGAAIMAAVLLGNLYIIPFKHTPQPWLAILVLQGPALSALIGLASTGSTYYGRWRILRRKERYDVRDDLLDQALNTPENLQNLPNQLGCSSRLAPTVLLGALALCFFTYLPAPLGIFGGSFNTAQIVSTPTSIALVPTATPLPTATTVPATATPLPTATATPLPPTPTPPPAPTATPVPQVNFVLRPTTKTDSCANGTVGRTNLTLDNTKSASAVGWSISLDMLGTTGNPWATAYPAQGTLAAGKTSSVTLNPNGLICMVGGGTTQTFHAIVSLTSGGTGKWTFTETVLP